MHLLVTCKPVQTLPADSQWLLACTELLSVAVPSHSPEGLSPAGKRTIFVLGVPHMIPLLASGC